MKILSTALFILLSSFSMLSQTGSIKGTVKDKARNEPLFNATVVVTGTSRGTVTDFDGNFLLSNLEPGTYSITVSYISYASKVFDNVQVKAGQPTTLYVDMLEDTKLLKGATVQAKKVQRTETALLALERKSASMLDGISSQEMSLMGTSDAAASLKKVTGVTVQDGKYVYVRGLGDRYMKTQLNGAEIPSLDPQKNTVQLDIFPSNIIDNMVIFKTFSPELPATFTGGYVNIITKDFPEKFTFQVSGGIGLNTKTSFRDNFLTYDGGSTDWLGFDDGSRDAPVQQGEFPEIYVEDKEKTTELSEKFNKQLSPKTKTSGVSRSLSVSLGNQTTLFGKPLGFVASVSYKKSLSFTDDANKGRYELTTETSEILEEKRTLVEDKGTEKVLIGALTNITYKYLPTHSIGLNLIINQSGMSGASLGDGYNAYHEVNYTTRGLSWLQRSFLAAQLIGKQTFTNIKDAKFNWLVSYSESSQSEPDLRFFNNIYEKYEGDTLYEIDQAKDKLPARYFREMNENNIDIHGDLIVPFMVNKSKIDLKTGGAYFYKLRTFDEILYEYTDNNTSFNGNVDEYLANENMGSNVEEGYGVFINEVYMPSNNYEAWQQLLSAYLMGDIKFTSKWRTSAGVRLENTYIETESKNEKNGLGTLSNLDILPALNITFSPSEKTNYRLAYTRTIAMPSFRELAPYASYDYQTGETEIGNTELRRTVIDNLDARWEYYMKSGEQISIGYFFKLFNNPIERTFNPQSVNPELTFNNVEKAMVHGIEIEIRKKLDFIGLDNFKAGGNLTLVSSTVQIEERELESIRAVNPSHGDTRQMAGQAPYIVNGMLSYDNEKHKITAAVTYNVSGEKLYVVVKGGTPNVYEQPRHMLGFGISKELNNHFKIKFSAKNLLDSKSLKTYSYKGNEYIYSEYKNGQDFSVGFTYKID